MGLAGLLLDRCALASAAPVEEDALPASINPFGRSRPLPEQLLSDGARAGRAARRDPARPDRRGDRRMSSVSRGNGALPRDAALRPGADGR